MLSKMEDKIMVQLITSAYEFYQTNEFTIYPVDIQQKELQPTDRGLEIRQSQTIRNIVLTKLFGERVEITDIKGNKWETDLNSIKRLQALYTPTTSMNLNFDTIIAMMIHEINNRNDLNNIMHT